MLLRRRRRGQAVQNSSSSNNVGQMMNLSLFIMLLAFFIVLNAISSYEDKKTESVKHSVEMAFSKNPRVREAAPSVKMDPAQAMKEGSAFSRIEALFDSEISSFKLEKNERLGIMMVDVPYQEFSDSIMAVGQKDLLRYPTRSAVKANIFLPTLASLLKTRIDGIPTRMEIIVHTKSNPANLKNQDPVNLLATVNQVGAFSRKLDDQGMPQNLINIGLSKGKPEIITLVFRRHIPFSPITGDRNKK